MSGARARMRLTVIGTGYLGLTHAVCMAELGHEVLALDVDHDKVTNAARGALPFLEPSLEQLLRKNLETGRLHFATSYAEVAEFGDVHFLCVCSAEAEDGTADLRQVYAAADALASHLTARCLVVAKSRLPLGAPGELPERIRAAAPAGDQVDFAWNPEFPGEAFAVKNSSRLGRDGFGVTSDWADGLLRQVYYLPLAAGEPAERVSVVIPARNEARNLPHVLGALPAGLHEVILVDGHSVDDTIKVARQVRPDVKIVQQTRRGKGNALACGFAQVTGDIIVMLDADGSADPGEIPAFVAALAAGTEFAKGTRFSRGGGSHDISRFRRLGNAALNGLVNLLFRTRFTDLCYGYNAFRAHLLPALDLPSVDALGPAADGMLWGDGFEIETLINVRAAHAGVRITEVGSVEKRRIHGVSNLNAVSDGIRVLRTILAERQRAHRIGRDAIANQAATGRGLVTARGITQEKQIPAGGSKQATATARSSLRTSKTIPSDCMDTRRYQGQYPLVPSEVMEEEAMTVQARTGTPWPKVSVVIPALNEARNLPHVFARIPPNIHEVILVDGYSVDDTVAVARELRPDVRVVMQTRRGKGNALACGFVASTGDVIAMIDADGSADPGEISRFVRALLNGADFAKGTRFADGGDSTDITHLRRLGNRLFSSFFNMCYGARYSDLCYGYNVFWRRHVTALQLDVTSPPPKGSDGRLWGDGFEIETLIHIRAAKAGLVVAEVPSFEHPRIHGSSNLSAFGDGLRILRTILTERCRARSKLLPNDVMRPAICQRNVISQVAYEGSIVPAVSAEPE